MPNSSLRIWHLPIFIILIVGLISTPISGCQPEISPAQQVPSTGPHIPDAAAISGPTLLAETSTATVPRLTITPTGTEPAGCVEKGGHLEKLQFDSKIIGKSQRVNVYFPPCYDQEIAGGYPVLFMLHGQGQDENFWVDAGIVEKSDALILSNQAAPFLAVLPYEEYNRGDILQSDYGVMFVEELIPWVESNLAVRRDYHQRAIGGNSRGAYWAFRLAFKYQGQFGVVGAHSIPFFGEPNALRLWIGDIPEGELPRLYLDIGDRDRYLNDAKKFQALLDRYEILHEWHLNPGEHDAVYWQENLEDYLLWYAQSWKAEASP